MYSCKSTPVSYQSKIDESSHADLLREIARLNFELGEKERLHRIEMEVHGRINSLQVDILRQENTVLCNALQELGQELVLTGPDENN
tara:strand:+ start:1735 stop:1995 length:261 start_codon:yes stop_codon:yes gene_type:complete